MFVMWGKQNETTLIHVNIPFVPRPSILLAQWWQTSSAALLQLGRCKLAYFLYRLQVTLSRLDAYNARNLLQSKDAVTTHLHSDDLCLPYFRCESHRSVLSLTTEPSVLLGSWKWAPLIGKHGQFWQWTAFHRGRGENSQLLWQLPEVCA